VARSGSVGVDAELEQPSDARREPQPGGGHHQVLEQLRGRLEALTEQAVPPTSARAVAEPELEQQLEPVLARIARLVVQRLSVVWVGAALQQQPSEREPVLMAGWPVLAAP